MPGATAWVPSSPTRAAPGPAASTSSPAVRSTRRSWTVSTWWAGILGGGRQHSYRVSAGGRRASHASIPARTTPQSRPPSTRPPTRWRVVARRRPRLLDHAGTDDTAADLEAIRLALGEPRLNYVGFSYGTMIGLRYLERFGTHARAFVLDGVVDPTQDLVGLLTQQTTAIDALLHNVLATCGPSCPLDDPEADFDRLAASLEAAPIRTRGGTTVGPGDLATAAITASYDPSAWTTLLDAVADGLHGDGDGIAELAARYRDSGEYGPYAAVICTDAPHPEGFDAYRRFAESLAAESPRLGAAIANELLPCAVWRAPVRSVAGPVRAPGARHVLVVGTTGDAATPYANARRVARTLRHATLLTFRGEGHTAYGRSRCVDRVVDGFLLDTTARRTVCR
ncbi:MAG: alpha/beta hydrolase [Microthrixaceae bacterium]